VSEGFTFEEVEHLIIKRILPTTETLVFYKEKPSEFEIVTLYLSLVELASGCLALIDRGIGYHSYPILRQMLEINAEILILLEDPSFLEHLKYKNLKSHEMRFRNAKAGNPYLSKIAGMNDFDEVAASNAKSLSKIDRKWARNVSVEEKFRLAQLEHVYDGLYRSLSDHTHSNFGALVSRHVKIGPSGDEPTFHAFDHGNRSQFLEVTTSLYECLLHISERVLVRFGKKLPK
jgi:hypothetical protein